MLQRGVRRHNGELLDLHEASTGFSGSCGCCGCPSVSRSGTKGRSEGVVEVHRVSEVGPQELLDVSWSSSLWGL